MDLDQIRAALAKAGVVVNGGNTLTTILGRATINGQPLNKKQKALVRRKLAPKPAPKRPGYREAVEYLANNDDYDLTSEGGPTVCVSMIAHLFGKNDELVVRDVLDYREKHDL